MGQSLSKRALRQAAHMTGAISELSRAPESSNGCPSAEPASQLLILAPRMAQNEELSLPAAIAFASVTLMMTMRPDPVEKRAST
jgi:hypothetical protein